MEFLCVSVLLGAQERGPELHGTTMLAAFAVVQPIELLSITFIHERALLIPSPKNRKWEEKQHLHMAFPRAWPEAGLLAWGFGPSQ